MGNFEFTIAHEVDGISDLQHYLVDDWHRLKVDEGMYRFSKLVNRIEKTYNFYFNNKFSLYTQGYIKSLIFLKWNGYWHQQQYRLNFFNRLFKYKIPIKIQNVILKVKKRKAQYEVVPYQKRTTMNYVSSEVNFYELTQQYTSNLLSSIDENYKYKNLVFDQLVPPFHLNRYLNYFDNLKVIIVDRDPRDLYILNKKYWNEGWIPTSNIEAYIQWFLDMRKNIAENKENVLYIQFEDLIYNYESELEKIENFLNLKKESHIDKKMYFNPDISMKNTQLWVENPEFEKEVKIIENKLKSYCYNFI